MTETNLTGAALEVAQKRETQGLNLTLGVHFTKVEPGLVEAEMRFAESGAQVSSEYRATLSSVT